MSFLLLFAVAFVAATLWPLGTELLFIGLVRESGHLFIAYWFVATAGNVLGAWLMLMLARWARQAGVVSSRWQPAQTTERHLQRWGTPLLAMAWLPVVGDLLPVAAGWLRMPLAASAFWLALGKGARFFLLGFWLA
ncbi:MAG: VTT domain-containing protein [Saccharospirillum sp.]|uniref:YqaA family protein n=1 Tax=Saccharospirillum sp. TaxID=2033801 RepID=UPI00329687E9